MINIDILVHAVGREKQDSYTSLWEWQRFQLWTPLQTYGSCVNLFTSDGQVKDNKQYMKVKSGSMNT